MTPAAGGAWRWQWPDTGPTAVNYGLDTEIFDSERFPHVQTFVREAIQNSLDARFDQTKPVIVYFGFHRGGLSRRKRFLVDLAAKKEACGLTWPLEWAQGTMTWLVVEDSNSSGLRGDLKDRTSDFWNYWLNFGISNKSGAGRGGRGIGRITFLIASGISTVIGVTRRAKDGSVAACGMSLLKPGMIEGEFKSSYAYLAERPNKSIYDLYDDHDFNSEVADAFEIADYSVAGSSGLSLIIPFPHPSLTKDSIIAAAIEHFAPAIISGALVVEADNYEIDAASIDAHALRVAEQFPPGPLREDPRRFLELIRQSEDKPDFIIKVKKASDRLADAIDEAERDNIRNAFLADEHLTIAIEVALTRHGKTTPSRLLAAVAQTPRGRKPTDLFFREGMCLPEVAARNAADVDLVIQSIEGELVAYLNFCEGKAHLGLIENKEVTAKLIENGFLDGYSVKRLVRRLMDELRGLVLPDATKPDASIFSGFFSIPKKVSANKKRGSGTGSRDEPTPPPPPPPLPPPQPRVFQVDELPDGFRIKANPGYSAWPINLRAEVAYADGSRRPKWSRYDFELKKLAVVQTGAGDKVEFKNNTLICRDCGQDFQLEIRGFDVRREIVTNVRATRNARTIRLTGRKQLAQSAFSFHLSDLGTKRVGALAIANPGELNGFPIDAEIRVKLTENKLVEVLRFGTIAKPIASADLMEPSFRAPSCQVRVVTRGGPSDGKLLGSTSQWTLKSGGEPDGILLFQAAETTPRLWRLDIRDQEPPILYVDERIPDASLWAKSDPLFAACVLPHVIGEVMRYVISGSTAPEDCWEADWVIWATTLMPGTKPPFNDTTDEQARWIDQLVDTFAQKHDLSKEVLAKMGIGP